MDWSKGLIGAITAGAGAGAQLYGHKAMQDMKNEAELEKEARIREWRNTDTIAAEERQLGKAKELDAYKRSADDAQMEQRGEKLKTLAGLISEERIAALPEGEREKASGITSEDWMQAGVRSGATKPEMLTESDIKKQNAERQKRNDETDAQYKNRMATVAERNAATTEQYRRDSIGVAQSRVASKTADKEYVKPGFFGEQNDPETIQTHQGYVDLANTLSGMGAPNPEGMARKIMLQASKQARGMKEGDYLDNLESSANALIKAEAAKMQTAGKGGKPPPAPPPKTVDTEPRTEQNPVDAGAEKWASGVLPRLDPSEPSGALGSGIISAFKNVGGLDLKSPEAVFRAIEEIDSYIPRLTGAQLERAKAARAKLMKLRG